MNQFIKDNENYKKTFTKIYKEMNIKNNIKNFYIFIIYNFILLIYRK